MPTKSTIPESTPLPIPQQGRKPSEEDLILWGWAKDTLKNSISLVNKILGVILTLNAALLTVSVFFDKDILPQKEKLIVLLAFIISLIISLIGLIMYEGNVQLDTPASIKQHKAAALKYKKGFVIGSITSLLVGLGFIIARLIHQMLL